MIDFAMAALLVLSSNAAPKPPASVSAMLLVRPIDEKKTEPLRYPLCDLFPGSPELVFGPGGVQIVMKTPPPAK